MKKLEMLPEKKRRSKKKAKSLIIAFCVGVALILGINQVSPRPFATLLKMTNAAIDNSVDVGPYAGDLDRVVTRDVIAIPVKDLPDAHVTIYETVAQTAKPVIFLIHGGGWMIGSSTQIADFAKVLAAQGYTVASLDYSLAPEYKYPTPVVQAVAALEYLNANAAELKLDMTNLIIGGNSAGAQIASQLGSLLTNPNYKTANTMKLSIPKQNLKGLLLFNGVYNFDTVGKDNFPGFKMFAWSYTGKKNYTKYELIDELSSVYTIDTNYPATFMTAGDADPLEPQTFEFDAILRAKGIDVTSVYWTGSGANLPHDYIFELNRSASQETFKEVLKFLSRVTAKVNPQ